MLRLSTPCASCKLAARRIQSRTRAQFAQQRYTSSSSSSSNAIQTFHTPHGVVRVDCTKPSLVGRHQSRGERAYQEDTFSVQGLSLDSAEASRLLSKKEGQAAPEQALFVGVYDGHNGTTISSYLKEHLHTSISTITRSEVNSIVSEYRQLGGYLRRYRGGILEDIIDPPIRNARGGPPSAKMVEKLEKAKKERDAKEWNVAQRIHAAFLKTDLEVMNLNEESGAVATTAILHSLDEPRQPFFSAKDLHILIAHLGDTRALLCTVPDGTAVPLTETHHPEARSETDRLMRTRTGAVTDSFGESRWAGTLANTRGFGDFHYKALGVFAEPAITSKVVKGEDYAFLTLMSDGLTDKLSDQEIVDIIREQGKEGNTGSASPEKGAKRVIEFAETIGAQDNLTCLVVPLAGWGKANGEDTTLARREYRAKNYSGISTRQRRM